ncbi:MAG: hypothetical protein AB1938_23590 [Myxococcota bacterium]
MTPRRALLLLSCGVALAGCEGAFAGGGQPPQPGLPGTPGAPGVPGTSPDTPWTSGGTPSAPTPTLPSAAVCQQAPAGRGYRGFAGEALEADREDVAAWAESHRTYPARKEVNSNDWLVVTEIARALGTTTQGDTEGSDPGVGAAFGVVPDSWFEESEVGAFAVYVTFRYAVKACTRAFGTTASALRTGWFEHTAFPPDQARAESFCARTQRAAWLREPTAPERAACVDLALSLDEPDVKTRWALVCASVFASPNFLAD